MMENKAAVRAFLALGQETRLNIFRLIVQRGDSGLCPSQLQELLGVPGATLSFHLRELCAAGLLLVQRQSRNLVYRADADFTQSLQGFLIENCCGGQACELSPRSSTRDAARTAVRPAARTPATPAMKARRTT